MKAINLFLSSDLANAIGWTIVHSLWQYAVMAILLGLIMILARRFSPRTRYLIAISTLGLSLIVSIVTFTVQLNHFQTDAEISDKIVVSDGKTQEMIVSAVHVPKEDIVPVPKESVATGLDFKDYFSKHLPFVVVFWFFGVLVLLLRFLGGVAYTQRIKYYRSGPLDEAWERKVKILCEKLQINKTVKILQSTFVSTPMLIGYLKPVILIPVSLVSGVSAEQLEMIIMHEIAHIKRNDYLINMVQKVMEIAMFYHPAIWWISSVINQEREICCDDIAVAHTENSVDYAKALVTIQEQVLNKPELAMAFTGSRNRLFKRIKRFVGEPKIQANFREGFVTACFLILGLVAVSFNIYSAGNDAFLTNRSSNTEYLDQDSSKGAWYKNGIDGEKENVNFRKNVDDGPYVEGDDDLVDLKAMYKSSGERDGYDYPAPDVLPFFEDVPTPDVKIVRADPAQENWTVNEKSFLNASFHGHVEVMKVLMENSEISDAAKNQAFAKAAFHGHMEVLKFLVDLDYAYSQEQYDNAFKKAAFHGHSKVLDFLINQEIDFSREIINSSFENAALHGHKKIIQYFFDQNLKVDEKSLDKAFINASTHGHPEIIKLLYDHGYDGSKNYKPKVEVKVEKKYRNYDHLKNLEEKETIAALFKDMNSTIDKTMKKMMGSVDYEKKKLLEDEMFKILQSDAKQVSRTIDRAVNAAIAKESAEKHFSQEEHMEVKADMIDYMYDELDKYMDPFFDKLGDEYMECSPRPLVVGGHIATLAITMVSTESLKDVAGVNFMVPLSDFLGTVFTGNPEEIEKAAAEFGLQMEEIGNSIGKAIEEGFDTVVP